MVKNWIICIEAAIILALSTLWYAGMTMNTPVRVFRLPEVQLVKGDVARLPRLL